MVLKALETLLEVALGVWEVAVDVVLVSMSSKKQGTC